MKPHPYSEIFPLMGSVELEELAADIKKNGLRRPIVTHEEQILDGRNRQAACDLACVPARYEPWDGRGGDPLKFVLSENLHRRHLTPSQRSMIGEQLLVIEKARAKERQQAAGGDKSGPGKNAQTAPADKSAKPEAIRARDRAAAAVGVAPKLIDAAAKVRAKAVPEILAAVVADDVAVSDAAKIAEKPAALQRKALAAVKAGDAKTLTKAVVAIEKKAQGDELRRKPLPMPSGPFGVIVADPPWQYDLREEDESHRGRTDYSTMPLADIVELGERVQKAAAEDCILWLWVTNAFLVQDDAPIQQVLRAWGFVGKTLITWDKEQIGAGHYVRNSTEHVVLAVRGRPAIEGASTSTCFHAKRREHSRKPEEFFKLVETICPDARRLEMFGRTPRSGWVTWGAQADKFTEQ